MSFSPETTSVIRRFVVLCLLITGFVFTVNAKAAVTAPCHEVYIDYYAEPELINWCGYRYNTCTHVYRDGCYTSPYMISSTGACCANGNDPGGPLCDC